jgi:hypothetical protein
MVVLRQSSVVEDESWMQQEAEGLQWHGLPRPAPMR